MGLFGRKKKEDEFNDLGPDVPYFPTSPNDLPPLPPLRRPSLKEQLGMDSDLPPLPPLPKFDEDFPPLPKENPLPPLPKMGSFPPLPLRQSPSAPPRFPKLPRMPEAGPQPLPPMHAIGERKPTHVFVRLDKYKAIVKALTNMESKVNELKNSISKINVIKDQEDKIIKSWEALLHEAKERVDDVSRKLPDVERD